MTSINHVGIDVSKKWLDAAVYESGEMRRFGNDGDGIAALLEWVLKLDAERIAFEATGGYERRAVKALGERGCKVAVVNPTRVRCQQENKKSPEQELKKSTFQDFKLSTYLLSEFVKV